MLHSLSQLLYSCYCSPNIAIENTQRDDCGHVTICLLDNGIHKVLYVRNAVLFEFNLYHLKMESEILACIFRQKKKKQISGQP